MAAAPQAAHDQRGARALRDRAGRRRSRGGADALRKRQRTRSRGLRRAPDARPRPRARDPRDRPLGGPRLRGVRGPAGRHARRSRTARRRHRDAVGHPPRGRRRIGRLRRMRPEAPRPEAGGDHGARPRAARPRRDRLRVRPAVRLRPRRRLAAGDHPLHRPRGRRRWRRRRERLVEPRDAAAGAGDPRRMLRRGRRPVLPDQRAHQRRADPGRPAPGGGHPPARAPRARPPATVGMGRGAALAGGRHARRSGLAAPGGRDRWPAPDHARGHAACDDRALRAGGGRSRELGRGARTAAPRRTRDLDGGGGAPCRAARGTTRDRRTGRGARGPAARPRAEGA